MKGLTHFLIVGFFMIFSASTFALEQGDPAPDFSLTDQDNQPRTLSTQKGKWLVLYFYPKNNTPGCTTEACSFRDNMVALQNKQAVVWGVSVDNNESHAEFAAKHKLPFPLLADPAGKVAKKYDALVNLMVMKIAKRHTFIIDPRGIIAKVYRDVDPKSHVEQVIKDLSVLQAAVTEQKQQD